MVGILPSPSPLAWSTVEEAWPSESPSVSASPAPSVSMPRVNFSTGLGILNGTFIRDPGGDPAAGGETGSSSHGGLSLNISELVAQEEELIEEEILELEAAVVKSKPWHLIITHEHLIIVTVILFIWGLLQLIAGVLTILIW